MRTLIATLIMVMCWTTPVYAETTRFAWTPPARSSASIASDSLLAAQSALLVREIWKADDVKHALTCASLRVGITMGITEVVKRTTKRERPDRSDHLSFWSGHAATTMAMSGWRYQIGVPIAIGTAYLRVGAKKHYLTDVLAGLGAGALSQLICKGEL